MGPCGPGGAGQPQVDAGCSPLKLHYAGASIPKYGAIHGQMNLPVTQQEYDWSADHMIVPPTPRAGITHRNDTLSRSAATALKS